MGTLLVPLGWSVLLDRLLGCQRLGQEDHIQAKQTLWRTSLERGGVQYCLPGLVSISRLPVGKNWENLVKVIRKATLRAFASRSAVA